MTTEIIHSNVAGTTWAKPPFHLISPADELTWERDPQNPADPNAIKLFWQGERVGFIKAALAKDLAPLLDTKSIAMTVMVDQVTGGEQCELFPGATKQKNRGINITITVNHDQQALAAALAPPTFDIDI